MKTTTTSSTSSAGKTDIRDVISERDPKYGGFKNNAQIHSDLMAVVNRARPEMPAIQHSAIMQITGKLARALAGDINYDDNWRDIIGYAQLVLDELERDDKTGDLLEVSAESSLMNRIRRRPTF